MQGRGVSTRRIQKEQSDTMRMRHKGSEELVATWPFQPHSVASNRVADRKSTWVTLCFAIAATAQRFPGASTTTRRHYEYGQKRKSDCWHPTFLPDLCLCPGRNNLPAFHESVAA